MSEAVETVETAAPVIDDSPAQLSPEQYQKEYDEAVKAMDEAEAAVKAPTIPEPEVKTEEVKQEVKQEVKSAREKELEEKVAIAEKRAKDNQAAYTKNQQMLAQLQRERELSQREINKPQILEANPELADAIKFVVSDPTPQIERDKQVDSWQETVAKVHPDIFGTEPDNELYKAVYARLEKLGDDVNDPLIAIREITAEKLAQSEAQVSARFAVEAQKLKEKSAMTLPTTGASPNRTSIDKELVEVNRIKNMSEAEFAKEVRRVTGY